ncbi:hypothetical protein PMALA_018430 [Plasmodium malariae]|uniref:Uncharacterized protein n=1 Tax=Plasmodium malariae TaxID=5858 RepID=A0A1A8W7F4_PLAMA|nr:hypothetical protein PMALA_018430 [Plasmodium malariae]
MTDRNKNLRSPFSNRTSNNKTEKTSNIGENDTNIPKSENIDFSIEVKNSFNKDKVNNHKSNIHDVNDEDCKRIASFTDKGEKIKDRLYTSSDIEDDDLIDNLDDYFSGSNDNIGMKQVKNSSARKRIYRVFYIRLFYALLLGIFGVLMQCYFIILSDSNYTMGDAPLKDRIHEIFNELPPYLNTRTINGCILFLLIFTLIRNKSLFENLHAAYLIITSQVYECTDLNSGYLGSFTDRCKLHNLFIWLIGNLEALDHRLNVAVSYDKEWVSLQMNSKSLIIRKKSVNNEEYYDFSEHFYHSYAGNGTISLSTIKYILHKIKCNRGIRNKN